MKSRSGSSVLASIRSLLFTASLISLAAPVSLAQTTAPASADAPYVATMTFDVVSVHESKPDLSAGVMVGGGFAGDSCNWKAINNNISNLITWAYNISSHQLEGMPGWASGRMYVDQPMYNVEARCDPATDAKLEALSKEDRALERQHMIQAMLEDRFQLKTHWETREASVFHLVAAKGGQKMQAGGSMPPSEEEKKNFGSHPIPEIYQRGDGQLGYEFIAHSAHMKALASYLQFAVGADVIDQTGLTGTYDFVLKYGTRDDAERTQNPEIWPPVPEAVEEELGLKLEKAKGSIRMLVVDHLERPSAN